MRTVRVNAARPYEVRVERGLLARAGRELLAALGGPCAVAVLTDDTVNAIYGAALQASLERCGFRVARYAIPHGEANKTLDTWAGMLRFLADSRLTRTDCVVALGGGVAGDMAGFAAASYLRGVALAQIPTTLLAMVDSSVGGKTGVNLPAGKNLAGAFWQPRVVLCDPDTLATLPEDTLADGVAEALKYGMLGDIGLFELLAGQDWRSETERVIGTCVAAKARLVEADERDTASRQLLNLGHTFGHAIEKCSALTLSHGRAVAVGMAYATRLAVRLGLCQNETLDKLTVALKQNRLPTSAPYGPEELCEAALSDKKRAGGVLALVLPREIGRCELYPAEVARLPELFHMAVEESRSF